MEVSTKPHSNQHFGQKAQREARYRGYDIIMQRRDLCWMVTLKPTRPELPIFQRYSFQTATQSEREALAQAKRRGCPRTQPIHLQRNKPLQLSRLVLRWADLESFFQPSLSRPPGMLKAAF